MRTPKQGCVQRFGKNRKGYSGETIDIGAVQHDFVAAAQIHGWTIEEILPRQDGSLA